VAILDYGAVAWEGGRSRLNAAATFAVLSLLLGTVIILVTPPRGPDETAHFLRAYGVAQGDFVPAARDAQGRSGVHLPRRLHAGFGFFENVLVGEKTETWSGYGQVFKDYFSRSPGALEHDAPPVFVPYGGG